MAGQALSRAKVYDPVLRILHACNGLAILLLVATSLAAAVLEFTPEAATLWRLHVWCGYALALGLAGRLANPNFADKAPPEVVLECKANLAEAEAQAALARRRLGDLG